MSRTPLISRQPETGMRVLNPGEAIRATVRIGVA